MVPEHLTVWMAMPKQRAPETNRPVCVHCGNAYGQRAYTDAVVTWRRGEPQPGYRGNGIVIGYPGYRGPSSVLEQALGRPKDENDEYTFFKIWDGQTWWGGYPPFCTLRCALDYARQMFKEYGAIT